MKKPEKKNKTTEIIVTKTKFISGANTSYMHMLKSWDFRTTLFLKGIEKMVVEVARIELGRLDGEKNFARKVESPAHYLNESFSVYTSYWYSGSFWLMVSKNYEFFAF